ncbi:dedicator of cytokinesis protein 10-like, partial [Lethenteron reissneri]|uniref:dedicator of cytokinesis protein 10-like n=1 Tax=Lethenteron reissneri TaxID=7753 RepID=UPI002AB6DA5A
MCVRALQAVFTVCDPHPDVLLLVRVEKVLQGSDAGRTSSDDWLRALVDVHKSEKMSKLQTIPGSIKITVETLPAEQPNMLTPGLSPVMAGWRLPETGNNSGSNGGIGKRPCVREVDDFPAETARHAHPYSEYANRLYVYPQRLKYDAQKIFPKARNIAIHVEFRDSDEEGTLPLKCIYGKAGQPAFISSANTAVLHHQQCPDFCDEVSEAGAAVHLHGKHHLLFTFSHISCDLGKRRDTAEAE